MALCQTQTLQVERVRLSQQEVIILKYVMLEQMSCAYSQRMVYVYFQIQNDLYWY